VHLNGLLIKTQCRISFKSKNNVLPQGAIASIQKIPGAFSKGNTLNIKVFPVESTLYSQSPVQAVKCYKLNAMTPFMIYKCFSAIGGRT
jgi:hypothetical protein